VIALLSPLIVFVAIGWSRLKAAEVPRYRIAALEAAVLLAAGVIVVSETLGYLHRFRVGWISVAWTLATALALIYLWRELRRPGTLRANALQKLRGIAAWRPPTLAAAGETFTIAFALAATGLIAWLAPPNTYDAISYQLPRVMHWFQQGSLDHFATSNVRQIAYGPGVAYWHAHLWALLDGDAAANLPQWFAYLSSAIALSLWVRRFFPAAAVRYAVMIGLTLPMAVLQASSAQTDLQVACWLLIGAVFLSARDATTISRAVFAGLACGLAVLTKPSAALCVGPIACLALGMAVRRRGWRAGGLALCLWGGAALVLCLPHFVRNTRAFGGPLGDNAGTVVTTASPVLVAANVTKWITLNLPSEPLWEGTAGLLRGAGIDPNHPDISFLNLTYSPAPRHVVERLLLPDEDFVSYTTTLATLGLAWILVLLTAKRVGSVASAAVARPHPLRNRWLVTWLIALLLHFLLLKWQFWGNRLILPCALLILPALAVMSGACRRPRIRFAVTAVCLLQTALLLVFSLNRPLVRLPEKWDYVGHIPPLFSATRTERFYSGYNREALPMARELVERARSGQWRCVGLSVGTDYPEYVLWRALHDAGLDHVELHHFQSPLPNGSRLTDWPPRVDGVIYVP
jgi:4-amino-4-deoxy-L-arabinose transferase-like glycosyltransferase